MTHICHCISDTNIGGAGVLLTTLLTSADKKKYRFSVLLPQKSELIPRLTATGATVIPLPIRGDVSFSPRALFVYMRAIRRLSPDIVHTHGCMTARVATRLSTRAKIAVTRHCAWRDRPYYHGIRRFLSKVSARLFADGYIATAEAARTDLLRMGVPPDRITTVPNGSMRARAVTRAEKAAFLRRYGLCDGDFTVGLCARLSPEKSIETLLYAMAELRRRLPNAPIRAVIAGTGNEYLRLMSLKDRLSLGASVVMTGFLSDPSPLYACLSLAVSCSVGTETSCLALSEAMAHGLPLVACDYGGTPFLCKNGESGILFPLRDHMALADAIEALYCDRALYRRLSLGAFSRYLAHFSAEKMAASYAEFYEKLTAVAEKRHFFHRFSTEMPPKG